MGETTAISWTDHTFNFVQGCTHAAADDPLGERVAEFRDPPETSAECDHCYAETLDHRWGGAHWGPAAPRRVMSDDYWRKPLAWNRAAERAQRRARVFCSSMADVFETHADPAVQAVLDSQRARLWELIADTPWLDWQLLTKRPENFRRYLPWSDMDAKCRIGAEWQPPWPHVWLGVTIGVRRSLWRARYLRETPAAVRFISGEPLLEHISDREWDSVLEGGTHWGIDWLIIGDESGHGRRPCQPDWVRTAREAAARHGVAFHFKQWNGPLGAGIGGTAKGRDGKVHLPLLDRRKHDARPQGIPIGQRDPVDPDHYP